MREQRARESQLKIQVMIREKQQKKEIVIDLTGPQGNAFFLLGYAKKLAKQFDFEDVDGYVDGLLKHMQSGDYEHLVQVFDDHFGDFIILER
tara:strand:- start:1602 stop:1877 length:276 start_codon:yes stop_codon:yes gene_type:complete